MKVWIVMEKARENAHIDSDLTLFDTKEKAEKYLEDRNAILYKKHNVEYNIKNTIAQYRKDCFGVRYKYGYDSYILGIHETEVL